MGTQLLTKRRAVRRKVPRQRALVPTLPRFIQEQIDDLIERDKRGELSTAERLQLDEVLEFVDRMTITALECLVRARARGTRKL